MKVLNNIFIETHGIHQLLKKHFETLEAERYRNAMLSDSMDSKSISAGSIDMNDDNQLTALISQALDNKSDGGSSEGSSDDDDTSDDMISNAIDFALGNNKIGGKAGKGLARSAKRLGIKLAGKRGGRIAQSLMKKGLGKAGTKLLEKRFRKRYREVWNESACKSWWTSIFSYCRIRRF